MSRHIVRVAKVVILISLLIYVFVLRTDGLYLKPIYQVVTLVILILLMFYDSKEKH